MFEVCFNKPAPQKPTTSLTCLAKAHTLFRAIDDGAIVHKQDHAAVTPPRPTRSRTLPPNESEAAGLILRHVDAPAQQNRSVGPDNRKTQMVALPRPHDVGPQHERFRIGGELSTIIVARAGDYDGAQLPADAKALVLWANVMGPGQGDHLRFSIIRPDGTVLLRRSVDMPKYQARRFAFVGRQRPGSGWSRGCYRGVVLLVHDGAIIDRSEKRVGFGQACQ